MHKHTTISIVKNAQKRTTKTNLMQEREIVFWQTQVRQMEPLLLTLHHHELFSFEAAWPQTTVLFKSYENAIGIYKPMKRGGNG
jgi:hypothetical protein